MTISELPAHAAACLAPLLRQLHDVHVARSPHLFHPTPDQATLETFLTTWLDRDSFTALLAGSFERPLGYLVYEIEHRSGSVLTRPETRMMVHHICVDAAHRNQGIGRAMMEEAKRRARAEGVDRIGASVHMFNTASAALMARSGLIPAISYSSLDF